MSKGRQAGGCHQKSRHGRTHRLFRIPGAGALRGDRLHSDSPLPAITWLETSSALPTVNAPNFSVTFEMRIPPSERSALDSQVGLSLFNEGKERLFIGKVQYDQGWVTAIYPESGLRSQRNIIPLHVSEESAAFRIHFDQSKMELTLHARTSLG